MPFIYKIVCSKDSRIYIGQTVDFRARVSAHRHLLRCGGHENRKLQDAFDEYGEESFSYEVIEECPVRSLSKREQHWIKATGKDNLFNRHMKVFKVCRRKYAY